MQWPDLDLGRQTIRLELALESALQPSLGPLDEPPTHRRRQASDRTGALVLDQCVPEPVSRRGVSPREDECLFGIESSPSVVSVAVS
jgi:hypothetical protein